MPTKRDYDHRFGYVPYGAPRAIFNLGIPPAFATEYKNLAFDGLAKEFVAFEKLYDTNPQAYEWLYNTGYGEKLYAMMKDILLDRGINSTSAAIDAIVVARSE
jgi:hypothetical protein